LAWQICREFQKEYGIRAIAICPGPGNTPGLFKGWRPVDIEAIKATMFSGELVNADEIAELISLASDPKMRNWTLTTVNNSGGLAQY
jgi:NAD(P)-dependent dehydrogenase (short-subunit alcohol dehydrogenase family)